jgi:hypothetical protein
MHGFTACAVALKKISFYVPGPGDAVKHRCVVPHGAEYRNNPITIG